MKLKADTILTLNCALDTFLIIKAVPAKFTKHLHGDNF